ncbi:hypothetical protein FRD01_16105 [Microvenator marinus]|uniref:Uncharacterized protein n=1 Tax=Microvenator marinus TaxID=2600177 RepID=A0A5B8XTV6_9DELT|nr:hypothetical protein [Microvenator marinus]QED28731.1 hypothetical protein FRD01_16105 [Microvenator marinus]
MDASVTDMKTGVIRVTPNAGIYANTGAFYEYMSTLLGATMPNQLAVDGTLFPPIILEQNGVSHRLNETTERWDLLQTRNIIFDMMLAPDGSVTIDGVQLYIFRTDINCAGSDTKSYAEQQDGPLLAAQCSVAEFDQNQLDDGTSSEGFGPCKRLDIEKFNCILLEMYAQTSVETMDTTFQIPVAVECSGIWPSNWPSTLEYCDFTTGTIRRPRVQMDEILMDSFLFFSFGPWSYPRTNVYESVQLSTKDHGICTNSVAEYQSSYVVRPKTRDGNYNVSEDQCRF